MQTAHTTPTYLTSRDVQALIRVDRSTIYRMAESGRLPAIKVGRQWRFPADAIERWLAGDGGQANTASAGTDMQSIADLFAELFSVMVIVTDIEGRPITTVSNPCGYFAAISSEAAALERCISEWKALGHQYDFEPRLRPSHLGFLCTRAFIRIENELAGMVIAGGIAPNDWPPSPTEIEAIAIESRVSPEIIQDSINSVHRLAPDDQQRLLAGVSILAKHLSRLQSNDQYRQAPTRSNT